MRQTPNAQRQDVAIVGGNKYGRYQKISSEQTYNMFISDNWLINTAGFQRFYEVLPEGTEGRGIFVSIRGNILIVVAGPGVYSFNTNLSPTLIGNLATETGEVFIDENLNSQICIVDGTNAYIYNYSLGAPNLTIQTGLGTLTPGFVTFHNTYFLFGNNDRTSNGSAWYAYQYATNTTITEANPGQFALQTKPDYAIAVVRLPSQGANVLVFGTSVCEVWTQIGGLQNYRRNSTLSVDYGCTSTSTIVTNDTYVVWLAENENNAPIIMIYTGQGFEPVSTDGIDYQLSKIKFPSQSTAMFYRQDGHLFYQLTFYNLVDNMTILYDLDTKIFLTLTDYELDYHPAREYAYFDNNMYFISLKNASLYLSSTDFTTYNENIPGSTYDPEQEFDIPRIRVTDTIRSTDSSQFRVNTFSFTMEQGCDPDVTGVSLAGPDFIITEAQFSPPNAVIYTEYGIPIAEEGIYTDIYSNIIPYQPRVDLTISRDGGITWSNTVSRNLNPLGYRQNILNWDRMGSANSITFKLKFLSTSRVMAYNGFVEFC
jgi:hypothetical protein